VNDIDDVLVQVRDSLSGAQMDMPVTAILARSRSRQRRRLARLSTAGVAAAGVLVLGLTGVFSSGSHAPSRAAGTIRTAAFTLVSNADGTDTLTVTQGQLLNPRALQQALTKGGIPAVVQTGILCSSSPAPPNNGVIRPQEPGQPNTQWVINPAVMPTGTELSFTYDNQDHVLIIGLIYNNAHTCSPYTSGS
jgi:hypothetical protein